MHTVLEYLLVSSVLNDRSHSQPISQLSMPQPELLPWLWKCACTSSPTCKPVIFAWIWKQKEFVFHSWDLGTQEYVSCNEFKFLAIKLSKKQSFRKLWRDKSAVWVVADWQIKRCNGMYQWISYSNISTPPKHRKVGHLEIWRKYRTNHPGNSLRHFFCAIQNQGLLTRWNYQHHTLW